MDKPARTAVTPTGREVGFGDEDIIVSKTDLKGHITAVNQSAEQTGTAAAQVLDSANNIVAQSESLRKEAENFLEVIRTG